MNKGIMLFCALALARAAYPITATKAYVDGATNATLAAAKAYTDSVAGVTPAVVTNIAGRVTSNVVTKAYVESLGISGGGADTNAVNDLIKSYDTTNLTARINAKLPNTWPMSVDFTNDVAAVVTNEIPVSFGDWEVGNIVERMDVTYSNAGVRVRTGGGSYWEMRVWKIHTLIPDPEWVDLGWIGTVNASSINPSTKFSTDIIAFSLDEAYVESTRQSSIGNALGLARVKDIPSTNGLVSASVVTGIVESASVTNAGAKAYADATKAPKLTGRTYDFANGVNFTKTLYTALTNVIQTLGGTVANPPAFN